MSLTDAIPGVAQFKAALRLLPLIGMAGALIFAGIQWGNAKHWRGKYDNEHKRSAELSVALHTTVKNYRAAAALAKRQAEANVARVKSEQKEIDDERVASLATRLADARARYERLRSGTPATNPGGAGKAGLPSVPGSPRGPDEAAGQDGLPPADALICTEQAIQLDELQKWVRRQSAVSPVP